MSILAGVIGRTEDIPVPEHMRDSLRRLISRCNDDDIVELAGPNWFMAKVDIGVLGHPAVRSAAFTRSMLAGEPLIVHDDGAEGRNRNDDLELLGRAFETSDLSTLARCTGAFCGVHYATDRRELTLFTDKLGLRPIYYWVDARFVVYASALRILENLVEIPKEMNIRGVTEIASFGFPLADRTAYKNIATLKAGEVVTVSSNEVAKREYWRWDQMTHEALSGSALAQHIYQRFLSAVRRRVGGDRVVAAFLSGGLDSRTIVSALRTLNVRVHTINWAPPGTQDEVFAAMASRALKTKHHQLTKRADSISNKAEVYNQREVVEWFRAVCFDEAEAPRLNVVWSGDGGSVGLGHVYLNPEIVALAQSGNQRAAVTAFLRHNPLNLAGKLFHPDVADEILQTPRRGIEEELEALLCRDRGRAFHLFLMLNDQRRHLADFYENIDLGRIELKMPFYDSNFLQPVLASPVNEFLGHRFYVDWLRFFAPATAAVPWQAYPGHVPCPLPAPDNLRYQWGKYYDDTSVQHLRKSVLQQAARLLESKTFPKGIIRRNRLRLAVWVTRLNLRNYDYAIRQALVYGKYAALAHGVPQR